MKNSKDTYLSSALLTFLCVEICGSLLGSIVFLGVRRIPFGDTLVEGLFLIVCLGVCGFFLTLIPTLVYAIVLPLVLLSLHRRNAMHGVIPYAASGLLTVVFFFVYSFFLVLDSRNVLLEFHREIVPLLAVSLASGMFGAQVVVWNIRRTPVVKQVDILG